MTSLDLDPPNALAPSPAATVSEMLASISFRLDLILTVSGPSLSASSSDQPARASPQIPIPVHQRRT